MKSPEQQLCFAALLHPCSQATDKSGSGLSYIPPAKPKLPGHEESYNPPKEYLPTGEGKSECVTTVWKTV